jgi:hypothetical protein
MTETRIVVLTCDRCGHVAEIRRAGAEDTWGKMRARDTNGARQIGRWSDNPESQLPDMCPTCTDELFAWWAKGEKSQCQPTLV